MKYISLFSGICAATVAWKPLKWEPLAFSEIEPFPSALLAYRYQEVPNLGDVSAIDWAPYNGRTDVVVGGSPCQAFSVAGLRKSLEDPRGNLTLEYVRAVHAIRPRYAVWENVPGVLSTADNAFGCFLAALVGADEALEVEEGWSSAGMVCGPAGRAAWRLLDAQWFGLAQRRLRVFVVFCPGDGADPGEILFERPRLLGHPPSRGEAGQGVTGSLAARTCGGGGLGTDFDCAGGLQAVPDVGFALNAKGGGGRIDGESETFVATYQNASEDGTGRGTPLVPVGFRACGQDGFIPSEVAPPITSTDGGGAGVPAVMTFHENQRGEVTMNDTAGTLKVGGGKPGQGYPAIAYNLRGREGGAELEPTDVASIRAASGGSSRTYVGVRRLTPTECERLQGFPEIKKSITINVWDCYDHPGKRALAETLSHRSLKFALSADGGELLESAPTAKSNFVIDNPGLGLPVVAHVLMRSGGASLEIRRPGRSPSFVSIAEDQSLCLQSTGVGGFAQLVALTLQTLETTIRAGREALHQSVNSSSVAEHGSWYVNVCGHEIEEFAKDAESAIMKAKEFTKCITSEAGQNFQNYGRNLQTLCSCVVRAICSSIPDLIPSNSSFALNLTTIEDYTAIPFRGKPAADGPRYKALGNSMAVPVMRWIGERIMEADAKIRGTA